MEEKFIKTFAEKTEDMVEQIFGLKKMEEDESGEQLWDRFNRIISEYDKNEFKDHPKYLLGMIFINSLEDNKKITDEEK